MFSEIQIGNISGKPVKLLTHALDFRDKKSREMTRAKTIWKMILPVQQLQAMAKLSFPQD